MNIRRRSFAPLGIGQVSPWFALGSVVLAAIAATPLPSAAQQLDPGCSFAHGSGEGPFDYRNQRAMLGVVEKRHFTQRVEKLQSGESTSYPGPDLHYTLNKFPNHHRALAALSRLGQKLQTNQVPEMRYTVKCYFERAIRFRPDDGVSRLIYARHLARVDEGDAAKRQLTLVANSAGTNPMTHYNIGLVAFELKDYDTALKHAHIAYAGGMPSPELRAWLMTAGKWVEPQTGGSVQAAPLPGAASAPPGQGQQ